MENTRLNAERDSGYRRAIEGCVRSGNGDIIAPEFAENKMQSRHISVTQDSVRNKLSSFN